MNKVEAILNRSSKRTCVRFALWCAEQVEGELKNQASIDALNAVRRWLKGQETTEAMRRYADAAAASAYYATASAAFAASAAASVAWSAANAAHFANVPVKKQLAYLKLLWEEEPQW